MAAWAINWNGLARNCDPYNPGWKLPEKTVVVGGWMFEWLMTQPRFEPRITNAILQSPSSETKSSSVSQETPLISYIPKIHPRVHNSPSPVPILCQINPVQALPSYTQTILRAFAKLRKVNISSVMLPVDGFWWNLIQAFSNNCRENSSFI